MGRELEYKLAIADKQTLESVLADDEIASLAEVWTQTTMKTTYFDTPDRLLCSRQITLRQRFEGKKSIVCVKIPLKESHLRGEWQIEAETIDEAAISRLVSLGAPKELVYFQACCKLIPVCGAEFLRRHVMLTFCDGSRAELAGDCGFLHGPREKLDFTECELELCEGDKAQMCALVERLCKKYDLHEEPRSKYARARQLG